MMRSDKQRNEHSAVAHAGFIGLSRSLGVAVTLGAGSMLLYPGGTALDHSTTRYSLTRNFLSDLGMTVAYNGRPNMAGAILFVLSLAVLVFAYGRSLPLMLQFATMGAARKLGWAAGFAGGLACAAFLGVAFTPENRWMALHVQFTVAAFRLLPVATFFLMLASLSTRAAGRHMDGTWAVLTAILAAYAAFLQWGPPPTTDSGLELAVLVQKAVTVAAVLLITYQIFRAGAAPHPLHACSG